MSAHCEHHNGINPECPICWSQQAADGSSELRASAGSASDPFANVGDIFGRDAFFEWFNQCWPEPKSKAQRGNWQHRKNMAYAGWMAAEERMNKVLRALEQWGILYNTPPLITDEKEWNELCADTVQKTIEVLGVAREQNAPGERRRADDVGLA